LELWLLAPQPPRHHRFVSKCRTAELQVHLEQEVTMRKM
jgi:hypothetical protein